MKRINEEDEEKKLLVTKTMCEYNFDEAMKKVVNLRRQLEKAQETLASLQVSRDKAENALSDFYATRSKNSKFYKKRL